MLKKYVLSSVLFIFTTVSASPRKFFPVLRCLKVACSKKIQSIKSEKFNKNALRKYGHTAISVYISTEVPTVTPFEAEQIFMAMEAVTTNKVKELIQKFK